MKRRWIVGSVVMVCSLAGVVSTAVPPRLPPVQADAVDGNFEGDRADVQIALLLDTSNSMDGLINQARAQLWTIVNEFNKAKRDGKAPRLQVALYEYGNDSLSSGEGHIRMVVPLTDDLDRLSEALFKLTTNGGSEYCGQVIQSSIEGLNWSNDPRTYRAIFIAGNEPFTQGGVNYTTAVGRATVRGIVVNTIHCGPESDGISGSWADGARRGDGEFMWINQDHQAVAIKSPQDEIILKLNVELNTTYLPFGAMGKQMSVRQVAQDAAAAELNVAGADVQRANAKASANYSNAGWDLVDALRDKRVDLPSLDRATLPEALQKLSDADLQKHVDELSAKRADIAKQIQALNAEREKFVAAERTRQATDNKEETFDTAAVKIVRTQLKAKGFETE
jgi:hypothetical protein